MEPKLDRHPSPGTGGHQLAWYPGANTRQSVKKSWGAAEASVGQVSAVSVQSQMTPSPLVSSRLRLRRGRRFQCSLRRAHTWGRMRSQVGTAVGVGPVDFEELGCKVSGSRNPLGSRELADTRRVA